jgi:hypothetical protein
MYDEPLLTPLPKTMATSPASTLILESTLTCPECGHQATETMPTNACVFFYECAGCGVLLRPKQGDCCVFCSFGTVPCPPIQQQGSCCSSH